MQRSVIAFPVPSHAHALHLLCAEETLLYGGDYACAVACGASGERCAVFGACAVAVGALNVGGYLEGLVHAFGDFFQSQFYAYAQVGASALAPTWRASGGAAERTSGTPAAEYVAEHREYVVHRHSACRIVLASAWESLRPHGVAELVVLLALFRVAEHVVGLGRLLEFFFSRLVARIFVGMVFYGELAIGFLYGVGVGVAFHAQHFIVVAFVVHSVDGVLFAHGHFCVAQHFVVYHISFLHGVHYFAFEFGRRGGQGGNGLVQVGVKIVAGAFYGPDPQR